MKIHSNSFTKTFLRSSPQYYHAEKRTTVSWTIWLGFEKAEMLYIYLDRGKFEVCHPGESGGPETRRMEQGATRSEGHVP